MTLAEARFMAKDIPFTYPGIDCIPQPYRWSISLSPRDNSPGHATLCLT